MKFMKPFVALTLGLALTGCMSIEKNYVDGQEYAGEYPVLHSGIIEDFEYPDPEGGMRSFAHEMSDSLATGTGAFAGLTSMTTGMSAMGSGVAVGLLGVVADMFAAAGPQPVYPNIVLREDNGKIVKFVAPPHLLERAIKFNCLDIGEPAKVINDGNVYAYIFHADTRLRRTTAFEPSCESLRKKYNVPLIRNTKSSE